MESEAVKNRGLAVASTDAYTRRLGRIDVIARFIDNYIAGDLDVYDPVLVEAVEFLNEEIGECRVEQNKIFEQDEATK